MLPLRFFWVWMLAGWVLVAGIVIGSVVPSRLVGAFDLSDKVMHGASYGLLMIWFAGLYARRWYGWIALFVWILGLAMELVQSQLRYRQFDLADLLANASGIVVGLLLSLWILAGWCQRLETRLGIGHVGH